MSKKINLTPALIAPITNRAEAEAFMRELARLGLDYHFDDGAIACLYENGHVTKTAAETIDAQVRACYAAWEASGADLFHDCPIGYMLDLGKYAEALNYALQLMEHDPELEPTSALKQAASDHEIPEGPPMASFVTWAFQQPPFVRNHMEDLPANTGASQVLADEIDEGDPTDAEIDESNGPQTPLKERKQNMTTANPTPLQVILATLVLEGAISAEEQQAIQSCVDLAYEDCPEPESLVLKRLMTPMPEKAHAYVGRILAAAEGLSEAAQQEVALASAGMPSGAFRTASGAGAVKQDEFFAYGSPRGEKYGRLISRVGKTVYLAPVDACANPIGNDADEAYRAVTAHEATLRPVVLRAGFLQDKD